MTTASKRVLVVDDEDVVCRSYERVLTQAGFEVAKAHSGAEAIEKMRSTDYDVMLADLKMPGMDGLEVVEKLRGTNPKLSVVVITGFPSQDTLHEAARLGVTDYLTKPVAPDVLTQATMQALAAPEWNKSMSAPPLMTTQKPEAAAKPFPEKLPEGPVVWPQEAAHATPKPPLAEPGPQPATPDATVEEQPESFARTAKMLVLAPVISLAYVMFLPLLGIGFFFGLGAKALARKVGALT
jgi:CheY-like chemotaxis protein